MCPTEYGLQKGTGQYFKPRNSPQYIHRQQSEKWLSLFPSLLQCVTKVLAATPLSCLSTVPQGQRPDWNTVPSASHRAGPDSEAENEGDKAHPAGSFLVFDASEPCEEVCHFRGAASSTGAEQRTLFRKRSGGDAPGSQTDSFLISSARRFVRMEGP